MSVEDVMIEEMGEQFKKNPHYFRRAGAKIPGREGFKGSIK